MKSNGKSEQLKVVLADKEGKTKLELYYDVYEDCDVITRRAVFKNEAVLWYLNAASETPSIIDIHSSGDAPLACLSKCYSTLAAQAKQDKNAELSAAFLAQAEDYQAQAEHWQAAI